MKPDRARTGLDLDDESGAAKQAVRRVLLGLVDSVKTRLIGGLILALPIAITFLALYQLYTMFRRGLLDPMADLVRYLAGRYLNEPLPPWWDRFAAPVIALLLIFLTLYTLGLFVRSRLHRAIDWVMLHMPVVTIVYGAVINSIRSIDRRRRVVLVAFPHPGIRALGFVTNSLRDAATGQTILTVWVVTGFLPPAGFTLFLPEVDVIDLDWTFSQALQAILSGGFTTPEVVTFSRTAAPLAPESMPPERTP